ncbi:flavodoxin-dependent (E)-4-hydroxy-3-methylbut-2-enyl-diphosphate synthase [Alkalibacter rhizosphaerae]|uniref:4-hydroxy-3-methylbut-2-en-1-yl diphosphate synthase (flavodoxin) n=1 Tax=Alkalibacter rhizosphaerae TaxID=2815577 RepID=A0A974XH87_9FIRM|nr:flavodoxin-dependent (E)-4-hydroxy-3-methylbut-2-enyl-diphosphate synthase [Alkalibacter rhizosphaerae]QSX08700.1 flavodoxin-dependent (E)-4-hydroxy-3-methylbut-2-enyl-diphosphate synthase [Alkalibacter rhizosphaerae]
MNTRYQTKEISIGNLKIGNGNPIAIQSMTTTDTRDVAATVGQIRTFVEAGCDIVRVAIPDLDSALALKEIKKRVTVPLVADIQMDYRLAIASLQAGVDKLRINPGNIGSRERVMEVVKEAKERKVPIRIGVNAGSVGKELLDKYQGKVDARVLMESAREHIRILEDMDFTDIIVSIKASDVKTSVESYRLFAEEYDYPTHIGITEAGTSFRGTVKSSVGLGIILNMGIGDTLRVSLTSDTVDEISVAKEVLKSLDLYNKPDIEFVSCPTCARCKIDLIKLAKDVERVTAGINKKVKVAIMGCAVNGPGEARDADIGIAGGDGKAILFKKGVVVRSIPEERIMEELIEEINAFKSE